MLLLQKLLLLSCNLRTEHVKLSNTSNSFPTRGHYLCRGGSHACMVTVNSVFEALGCAFVFHTYLPRSGAQSWSILCVCVQGCVSVCVNTDLFSFVKTELPRSNYTHNKAKAHSSVCKHL